MEVARKLIVKETPLNGYMEEAYPLTVAVTRECSYEWIYSNFIQLTFQEPLKYDNQPLKFYKLSCNSGYIWDADCPLLNNDTITRDMISATGLDIIDFLCTAISCCNYVMIYLDEFYLPYRSQYQRKHYTHESLFFGFDYDKKELYGLAYVTDEAGYSFKEFAVAMDKVRQAYNAPFEKSVRQERIILMSCNHEKHYEFDLKAVKNSIYEYINSLQTDQRYTEINNHNEDYIFGLRIYDELIKYYSDAIIHKSVIPLHIIYEHKKLMRDRIMYMIDNNHIGHNKDILDSCKKIIDEAYKCKLLFIKYDCTNKESDCENLVKRLNEIKKQDKDFMEKLYLLIDENMGYTQAEYKYSHWGLWRDVAYRLNMNLYKVFDITFNLHVINDKSQGYIRVSNQECLNNYYAPFILKFDVRKEQFLIADSYDQKAEVLGEIKCKSNSEYLVKFILDLDKRKYCVSVSNLEQSAKYENTYAEEVANRLQYINYLAAIHENSYRFAISGLCCTENNEITKLL